MPFFFFFSSRRRHTRLQGDWSSDVCSSDLCNRTRCARRSRPTCSVVRTASCWTLTTTGSAWQSEEHTSELQSPCNIVCRLLLEKKKKNHNNPNTVILY